MGLIDVNELAQTIDAVEGDYDDNLRGLGADLRKPRGGRERCGLCAGTGFRRQSECGQGFSDDGSSGSENARHRQDGRS